MRPSSRRTISAVIRSSGWRIVVSAGCDEPAMLESSKPPTATSSGTRRPARAQRGQRAGGHQVGADEDRVEVGRLGEQLVHRDLAAARV